MVTLQAAETTELRQMVQSLEIDLDSLRNLKASLENSLEIHYAMQMEQLNGILLHLESGWPRPGQRGSTRPRSVRPC